MKNKYIYLSLLMLLSIIVTVVFMCFMPDTIPAHYNAAGEIDRYGSKYESLLFPTITVIIGMFFILIIKFQNKKASAANEKFLLISGIVTLLFFNIMFAYFLFKGVNFKGVNYSPESSNSGVHEIYRLTSIGLGAVFCIFGIIMPKVGLNSVVGLRTAWSMKNDCVWKKSQLFGGISMAICGISIIVLSLIFDGIACLIFALALLILDGIVSTVASYIIYKKYEEIK